MIAGSGDFRAAPALLKFALDRDQGTSECAAGAIQRLLSGISPLDLVSLDQSARKMGGWESDLDRKSRWASRTIRRIRALGASATSVAGIASFHQSGFTREAATRELARLSDGGSLPFLLIRANDWVDPVRKTARRAIQKSLPSRTPDDLVRSLPLILRLRECGRDDHEGLVSALLKRLVADASKPAVATGITSADRAISRGCLTIAMEQKWFTHCRGALTSSDSVVRLLAARFLLTALPEEGAWTLAGTLAADSWPGVREVALRTVIERSPRDLRARLEAGLLDRAGTIRQLAGYYAQKMLNLDLAAYYRTQIAKGHVIAGSVLGLGEHGTVEDALPLLPCLEHSMPSIQRFALRSMARLDLAGSAPLLSAALQSDLPGVSNEAREILRDHSEFADRRALETALLSDSPIHVRLNALQVLSRVGKWPSIRTLLLAVAADPDALLEAATSRIEHWLRRFNSSAARATNDELLEIRERLREARGRLSDRLCDAVESCLSRP